MPLLDVTRSLSTEGGDDHNDSDGDGGELKSAWPSITIDRDQPRARLGIGRRRVDHVSTVRETARGYQAHAQCIPRAGSGGGGVPTEGSPREHAEPNFASAVVDVGVDQAYGLPRPQQHGAVCHRHGER